MAMPKDVVIVITSLPPMPTTFQLNLPQPMINPPDYA